MIRPDGVQHIAAGQIERQGDLYFLTGGAQDNLVPLSAPHKTRRSSTPPQRWNGVVGMQRWFRNIAAGHAAVGSVDDSITPKRCNVTCQRYSLSWTGVRSSISVMPFAAVSACRYSSCVFRKLSIHTPGARRYSSVPQRLSDSALDTPNPIFRAFFQK